MLNLVIPLHNQDDASSRSTWFREDNFSESIGRKVGFFFEGTHWVTCVPTLASMIFTMPRWPSERQLILLPRCWEPIMNLVRHPLGYGVIFRSIEKFAESFRSSYLPQLVEENHLPPCRFIQHFLVLFAMHQMSTGLYRFLAAIGRTQVMANMLGTAALIAIYIFGGFIVSKG